MSTSEYEIIKALSAEVETWRTTAHDIAGQRDALRAKVERLKVAAWDWQMKHDEQAAEADRLRDALESIEANTCCDKCQEAALVARLALSPPTVPCPNCGSCSTRETRADSGECTVCGCIFVWSVLKSEAVQK